MPHAIRIRLARGLQSPQVALVQAVEQQAIRAGEQPQAVGLDALARQVLMLAARLGVGSTCAAQAAALRASSLRSFSNCRAAARFASAMAFNSSARAAFSSGVAGASNFGNSILRCPGSLPWYTP